MNGWFALIADQTIRRPRMMKWQVQLISLILILSCAGLLLACEVLKASDPSTKIDDAALRNVEARPGDWLTHGRNYGETRFSPLKQVSDSNVSKLGLAWSFDTNTDRGLEATPLIVDGVMYTTGS